VFVEGRALLVHTRLAIIDTSPGGAQPMRSADDRHVIVQNGEIYDFQDHIEALERRGFRPRTHADTEVLLESLALDGVKALDDLRGMWAFACWDRDREELLLARDRLGKKPLVWTRTEDYFAFASEARALLKLPFVRAKLDTRALPLYLRHLYVPAPYTMLDGVRKLPPASFLRIRRGAAPSEPERYWLLPPPDPEQRADDAWFEAFDAELIRATRLRTVSDVPIGVFLSGGIDSNVVLEALHRCGHRPIRTLTLGFRGLPDERPLAALGAKRFSDEHVEVELDPDLSADVEATLQCFGDPLGDSAVVTNALIAREAAKHVKVILNGDGGDELFGGYARYPFARRADLARGIPGALSLLRRRYASRDNAGPALDACAAGRPLDAARRLGSFFTDAALDRLLANRSATAYASPFPEIPGAEGPGLVDSLFAWDTGCYLPDDLLVKVDVASMAHAVENRSPLLDSRLFEHVARLEPSRRVHPRDTKHLLKRHARGRIPDEVLSAPKRGFPLPLADWLHGPLGIWLDGLLAPPQALAGALDPKAVRAELDAFRSGTGSDLTPLRLWGIAALEFWARYFSVETGA
jgi:asparagine synthase (glutamine-hydrolysing)